MGGIKTRVKFFGPFSAELLEEEINLWLAEQGEWFRIAEATAVRHSGVATEVRITLAVFYEEILPGQSPSLPEEDEAGQ